MKRAEDTDRERERERETAVRGAVLSSTRSGKGGGRDSNEESLPCTPKNFLLFISYDVHISIQFPFNMWKRRGKRERAVAESLLSTP